MLLVNDRTENTNLNQMLHLTMPRIPMQNKLTELKQKISTLDSDEGIKVDSGKGTKIFFNKRPDTYVVEIVREKKHSSEDIKFIQNIDDVIALVVKTLGKSFSIIEY